MSDHDEALLDEDLGDEVYDLGNDEEEALLADDEIDNERLPVQQSYSSKADEETDDVLDLGVTDAFDDLVTEDENVQSKTKSHVEVNICQKNDIPNELSSNELRKNQTQAKPEAVKNTTKYESIGERGRQQNHSDEEPSVKQKSDLREKLKERNNFHKHNQATDDEDGEELKERRNRFQSERTVVPTKANQEIPDSLEKVVTSDQHIKAHNRRERDKNRDRSERFERRTLSNRPGGRYDPHLPIRYHHGPLPPTPGAMHYRPENRSFQCGNSASGPLPLPVSSLGQPRHSMYPPIPSYHHPQNSGSHPHYNDPQLPMLPNQYPEPMQPSQLPSLVPGPLIDYRSRGPAPPPPGIGPAPATYGLAPLTFPPVPYSQHMTEHSSVQVMTGNQASLPLPSHRPSTYDSRMTNSYESGYEMRSKPPANFGQTQTPIGVPYSSQSLQQCRQQSQPPVTATPQEVSSSQKLLVTPSVNSISNVPVIPTGHKILINPHFKGKIDNKTLHDPAETFVQALRNASNSSSREGRSSSHQAKSDDPFSYFSDMWQESKSQRVQNSHSHRSYSPENNYSKSSSHDKFKSDLQWSHKNEHLETSSKKNYDSRDYNEHKKSRDVYRDKDREREKDRDKDKERKREKELSPKTKSDVTDSLLKNSHKIDDHDNLVNKPVHEEKKKFSHHSGKETVRTVVKRTSDTSIDKFTVDKVAKKLKIPQKHSSNKNVEENIQKQEEEELDPEMKEYRMKMEEQKRLREKIILEKENRRKLAAMEKNKSEHSNHSNEIEKARVQLTIVSTEKEIKKGKTNLSAAKTFESLTNVHSSEESTFGFQSLNEMKKYRKKKLSNVSETEQKSMEESKGEIEKIIESDQESDDDTDESDTAMREFIEKDSDKSDEDDGGKSKLLSRIVLGRNKRVLKSKLDQSSIIQKPTVNAHRQLGQIRKLLANPQRIVVSAASKIHQKNNAGTISQRNIVHKSEAKKLLKSNIVRVDNLAATTTEHQIRKMCQGIGSIESIQMGEGNATIIFKTQSAAMVFHKKYQRKMLDLSLIKVQLISQIAMSKNSSKH